MGVRQDLGADLDRAATGGGGLQTFSAKVADVTDTGVNLDVGGGELLLNVPCATSYQDRAAGQWVAVRRGTRPVVLWQLGADPAVTDAGRIQAAAEAAVDDLTAVTALTWGTGAPPGAGWQAVTQLFVKKDAQGKGQLYCQLGTVTDPSPDTPAGRPPKPVTISPTASGTWRDGRRDDYASAPTQGDWTGRGNRRGAWFYGGAISAACSGKTVDTMRVAFTRRNGSGVNAKRPLHLYLHNYTSPPSALTLGDGPEDLLRLSVGANGTASLPASWRSQLASGAAEGLAIYAQGSTDYMAVTGGKLTITFKL